jgi:hypothetical protein
MQQFQDLIPYQYLIVAAAVLVALLIVTLAFRAMAGRRSEAGSSRLGISEYLEVDKQRRLVLVRRDEVEHLILIGGNHDVVVEAAIRPGVQRREDAPSMIARALAGDRVEAEPMAARPHPMARPVPLRAARPGFAGQAPAPQAPQQASAPGPGHGPGHGPGLGPGPGPGPGHGSRHDQGHQSHDRPEPRLASLKAEDKGT